MALHFIKATPTHVPQIVALVESAYRGEHSKKGWTTEADLLDGQRTDAAEVLAIVQAPDQAIILAFDGDQLLASAQVDASADGDNDNVTNKAAMFGMFAVAPNLQGGGVGKALLSECERVAHVEFGCREMVMWVIWMRQSLIEFYQRRGYQIIPGVQHAFPYGDPSFGLPKREDLYFIEMRKNIALAS